MTDRPRYTAPMPEVLRHHMRAGAHPARSVPCGHCGAREHQSCTTPSKRHTLPASHPRRVSDWARTTACCPECQVEPGITCHDNGKPLATVHDRRVQEAEETLA